MGFGILSQGREYGPSSSTSRQHGQAQEQPTVARGAESVVVRRFEHVSKPPDRYVPPLNYVMLMDCKEPSCYKETLQVVDSKKRQLAMQSEMTALHKNQTWDLVQLPEGKKALPCKWVYRFKLTLHDGKPKYKARLVAKGFKKKQGIDFDEVFLPVVKMTTLRSVLALVAKHDLNLHQIDVKIYFLHGDLHEEAYMQQPEGYIEKYKEALLFRSVDRGNSAKFFSRQVDRLADMASSQSETLYNIKWHKLSILEEADLADTMEDEEEDEDDDDEEPIEGTSGQDLGSDKDDQDDPPSGPGPSSKGADTKSTNPFDS
ncbi:hypothetical protein L7F22_012650 [Adiantum nelumboides]|nr:hypothetical protein [Adiantum nelumboides]